MNNSPVLKLQDMVSSSVTDIEELLLRAKIISVKLNSRGIAAWLRHELNGYPSNNLLPDCHIIKNAPIRTFNPYAGWIPHQLGNTTGQYKEIHDSLATIHVNNPVSILIEYAKSNSTLYSDMPEFMTDLLRRAGGCDFRMAWKINPAQIVKILSNIKSEVLDWSLALESNEILGEELLFSQKEQREATAMTVSNISNFNGNVHNAGAISADNTGDIHQQNNITSSGLNSLARQLKEHGLDDADVIGPKQLVKQTTKPGSREEVEKGFGSWTGRITGKAFAGGLEITGAAVPALLTNALYHYFNIPV